MTNRTNASKQRQVHTYWVCLFLQHLEPCRGPKRRDQACPTLSETSAVTPLTTQSSAAGGPLVTPPVEGRPLRSQRRRRQSPCHLTQVMLLCRVTCLRGQHWAGELGQLCELYPGRAPLHQDGHRYIHPRASSCWSPSFLTNCPEDLRTWHPMGRQAHYLVNHVHFTRSL